MQPISVICLSFLKKHSILKEINKRIKKFYFKPEKNNTLYEPSV